MAFVVMAKWTATEGEAPKVQDSINKLTPLSRDKPLHLFYHSHRDP